MDLFLQATITGLATAAILAIAASGLVLTYTTTGIFNFAQGAVGMLGAFAFWQLRFDWGWPTPLALAVVLGVLAPLLGLVIDLVVTRQLHDAPEASRVVVTVGLLAAALGGSLWLWDPEVPRPIEPFWGTRTVSLLGVRVTWHELLALGTAIGLAFGLRLLLHRTRAGLGMRAAVDNRALAQLSGADPGRSAMLAWAIGAATAALSGILVAPTVGLSHVSLTLMIVNAYAAAIIGRLRSLPMTFLGATLLGLFDAYALAYLPTDTVLLAQFRFAIPAVLLFVVLLVLPQRQLRRRPLQRTREIVFRPAWRGSLLAAAGFVAAGLVAAQVISEPDARLVQRAIAVGIIALSLVPLVGFAGQLSLAQMSFAGIGALLMAYHGGGGSLRGLVAATVVTAGVGALVALPTLRLAGIYLALMTAAFAMLLDQWVFGLRSFDLGPVRIRLFESGSVRVDPLDVPGVSSEGARLVFLSVVFALLYLLVVGLRRSRLGHKLLAMKDSPSACATLGINPAALKLAVFTLSAGMAGFGGALLGGSLGRASAESFAFVQSLPLLLMTVVGGVGSAAGALAAGALVGGLPILLNVAPWYENVNRVLPGTLGIALGRNPNGFVPVIRAAFAPLARAWAVVTATLAGLATVVGLALGGLLGGTALALALLAVPLAGGLWARLREGLRTTGRDDGPPLEWVGIERPFEPADAQTLDRALGLDTKGALRGGVR